LQAKRSVGSHCLVLSRSSLTDAFTEPSKQVVRYPSSKIRQFAGLPAELPNLERRITMAEHRHRTAVLGTGGRGEIRLVLKFAYSFVQPHEASPFRMPAPNLEWSMHSVERIAEQFLIRSAVNRSEEVENLARRHLSAPRAREWLLIFDNADDIGCSSALDNGNQRPQRRRRRTPSSYPYPVADNFAIQYTFDGIDEPGSSSAPRGPSLNSTGARKRARPQCIKPCYLMVALGGLAIGGSLAVGLYYSIAQDRMGDGFTTAGWMVAVSTLMLAAPMAKHYPNCCCWDSHEHAVL
jgi:hypothetical protein